MKALAISASQAAGEDEEGEEVLSKTHIGITLAFSLVVAVGLFFVLPVFLTSLLDLDSGFAFWAVEGVIRVAIFLAYIVGISFIPDLRRVFQYHGAEHMTIHAHERGEPLDARVGQPLQPAARALRHGLPADRHGHLDLRLRRRRHPRPAAG